MTARIAAPYPDEVELLLSLVAGWPAKMGRIAEHLHFVIKIGGSPAVALPYTVGVGHELCEDPRCRAVRWLRAHGVPVR